VKTEIEKIKRQLEKAFDGQPWYGTSVKGILKEVDPSLVHKKIGPHSIIVLLLHMVAWRRYVTKKLSGDNDYKVTDAMNFPEPATTPKAWTDALNDLAQSQEELINAMSSFPSDKLDELVPAASHKYTWYTLLHGIVQHDIYHLGQIAIIRKALEPSDRS
jgi:uncharacterized damage-inducible protein DinB